MKFLQIALLASGIALGAMGVFGLFTAKPKHKALSETLAAVGLVVMMIGLAI